MDIKLIEEVFKDFSKEELANEIFRTTQDIVEENEDPDSTTKSVARKIKIAYMYVTLWEAQGKDDGR